VTASNKSILVFIVVFYLSLQT